MRLRAFVLNQNTKAVDQRMYLWWSLYTLYLHACQVRVSWVTQVFVVVLVLCILRAN